MEANTQRTITDYFSYFEEFYNKIKSCFKDCHKCAIAINKFLLRLQHFKNAEIRGTPLEEFEGIDAVLILRIHNLLSEEVREIRRCLSEIEELFENLCLKQKKLTQHCEGINSTNSPTLVNGTPLQPPLKVLLQFSEDTITFGSEICALVETALSVLAFKAENTEGFKDNFQIPLHWQHRASEIISYTSFCSQNILS